MGFPHQIQAFNVTCTGLQLWALDMFPFVKGTEALSVHQCIACFLCSSDKLNVRIVSFGSEALMSHVSIISRGIKTIDTCVILIFYD